MCWANKTKKINKRNTNETKQNWTTERRCDVMILEFVGAVGVVSWRRHTFHLVASFRRVALFLFLISCPVVFLFECLAAFPTKCGHSPSKLVDSYFCGQLQQIKWTSTHTTHTWQKWQNRQIGRKAMCNTANSEQLQCTKCTGLHTAHSNEHTPSTVFLRSFNSFLRRIAA